jgi:hypothetical protein
MQSEVMMMCFIMSFRLFVLFRDVINQVGQRLLRFQVKAINCDFTLIRSNTGKLDVVHSLL